jgi:iron complex outermembrane receptor protein
MAREVSMGGRASLRGAVRAVLAAGTGVGVGIGGAASAQDDVAVQQKITVTGSRIKRVDLEGPQPLTVIDRSQIDASGDLSVADVLRSTTYNTFGSFQQRSGSDAQSQNFANMRGLGADKTLVLLDGRRMAGSPLAAGQAQNLSVIPMAAVERIEILRDGASAIYGTDAIAGVINIILRKDYEGLHLGARASRPTQAGGDEDQYNITGGVSGAKGNITFAFDAWKRDIVFDGDRSFTATGLSGFGYPSTYYPVLRPDDPRNPTDEFITQGGFADPRCPDELLTDPQFPDSARQVFPFFGEFCRYNFARASATQASNDAKSFFINAHYDLTETTSFFARGLFTHNESFGRYAAVPVTPPPFIPADSLNNPTDPANPTNALGQPFAGQSMNIDADGDGAADTTVDGPFDYTLFYRNVPGGFRDGNLEDVLVDYLAGVEGTLNFLGGMDWDLGAQWSQQTSDEDGPGFLLLPSLQSQITSGTLDVFAVNNASLDDAAEAAEAGALTITRDSRTRIAAMDGQVSFDAAQLPNGPMPVALGFEYRDEDYDQVFDEQTQAGNVTGSAKSSNIQGARAVKSLFAETVIPVFGNLELNVAGRYDDYNDFGTTWNPKASLAFRPIDVLLLRASYGQGFEAPSLSQLYSAPTQSGTDAIDSFQCSMTDADTDGDGRSNVPLDDLPDFHPCRVGSWTGTTSGNRNLDPEESTSWSAGFVFNPIQHLAVNLDYYDIEIDNAIDVGIGQDAFDVEFALRQAGATGQQVGDITRSRGGQVIDVFIPTVNRVKIETSGLDADVSYSFGAGRFGDFSTRVQWTHVIEFKQPSGFEQTELRSVEGEVGFPQDRGWLSLNWSMGDYAATIVGNYVADQDGSESDPDAHLASFTTWDVQVSYSAPWGSQITVGARNVFDKDPPLDNDGFYDNYQHDVFGRVPYVRWEQDL